MKWYRDIKNFFLNIYYFRKTLWNFHAWDWSGFYQSMYDSLIQMEKLQREHGHSLFSGRCAKQMRICLHLIKRIQNEEYAEVAGSVFTDVKPDEDIFIDLENGYSHFNSGKFQYVKKNRASPLHSHKRDASIAKQDVEMLFNILRKHSRTWWD